MVEGKSSKNFQKVKGLMFEQPQIMHQLLDKLAQAVTAYLNAQIAAGADTVMIFDTWGGMLSHDDYLEFSLRYAQQIRANLRTEREGQAIPSIWFTKGGGLWLEAMANCGFNALGLDWQTDIGAARARVGDKVALQGNLDPISLYAKPEVIRNKVAKILQSYGSGSGHIFNLGHGILPDINPEHVAAMVAAVRELSPQYHGDI